MIKSICRDLMGRLLANGKLPFIDIYSGLVQTVQFKQPNADDTMITKRMPVSYNVVGDEDCTKSPEKAVIPNSKRKGIIYFEDNTGISVIRELSGGRKLYRATLVMVVWLNRRKITGDNYANVAQSAYEDITAKLRKDKAGENQIKNITFNRFRQEPAIFAKYSYDETETQFLRPPFEYFAVDVTVNFVSTCQPSICINENNC